MPGDIPFDPKWLSLNQSPYARCQCMKCHVGDTSGYATDCTCTCDPNDRVGVQAKYAIWHYNDTHDDEGNECRSRSDELIHAVLNGKENKMGEFPALNFDQLKGQALGFVYGCAVAVGLAVAIELSGVESFENVSLAGVGLTALRSAASFVTLFFTQRNIGGK